jgi:hypothetical protein
MFVILFRAGDSLPVLPVFDGNCSALWHFAEMSGDLAHRLPLGEDRADRSAAPALARAADASRHPAI